MLKIDHFWDFQALVLTGSGRSDFLRCIFKDPILSYQIYTKSEKNFRHIRKLGGVIGGHPQHPGRGKLIQSSHTLPKKILFYLDQQITSRRTF